jgi:superfamily II DNA helicase RecQ
MPGKRKTHHDIDFTLKRVFGKRSFRYALFNLAKCFNLTISYRPLQREVIVATLEGEDVFLQAATSFGKSLCYQLPSIVDFGSTSQFMTV